MIYVNTPLVIIMTIILAISLFCLVLAATTDPGYIPKQIPPFANGPIGAPTLGFSMQLDPVKPSAVEKKGFGIIVNGRTMLLKTCQSCLIVRPPRSFHCTECGMCVERFDHHCPWLSNCIGKQNYRYFFACLISTCLFIWVSMITSIYFVVTFVLSYDELKSIHRTTSVIISVLDIIVSLVVKII